MYLNPTESLSIALIHYLSDLGAIFMARMITGEVNDVSGWLGRYIIRQAELRDEDSTLYLTIGIHVGNIPDHEVRSFDYLKGKALVPEPLQIGATIDQFL